MFPCWKVILNTEIRDLLESRQKSTIYIGKFHRFRRAIVATKCWGDGSEGDKYHSSFLTIEVHTYFSPPINEYLHMHLLKKKKKKKVGWDRKQVGKW